MAVSRVCDPIFHGQQAASTSQKKEEEEEKE